MSELSSHKLTAEDKLRSSSDSQQRVIRSMENKQRALNSDLETSKHELTTLQEEYDNYKVSQGKVRGEGRGRGRGQGVKGEGGGGRRGRGGQQVMLE